MQKIDPQFKQCFKRYYKEVDTPFGKGYELTEDIIIDLPRPFEGLERYEFINVGKFTIQRDHLSVFKGFRWDGSSGSIDTENAMLASLMHDCFCVASKQYGLDYRRYGDDIFADVLKWQGVNRFRAWYHGVAVKAYRWVFCW